MDIKEQASRIEQMCSQNHGSEALDELQSMSREDQRAVYQQMKADAGSTGKVYAVRRLENGILQGASDSRGEGAAADGARSSDRRPDAVSVTAARSRVAVRG